MTCLPAPCGALQHAPAFGDRGCQRLFDHDRQARVEAADRVSACVTDGVTTSAASACTARVASARSEKQAQLRAPTTSVNLRARSRRRVRPRRHIRRRDDAGRTGPIGARAVPAPTCRILMLTLLDSLARPRQFRPDAGRASCPGPSTPSARQHGRREIDDVAGGDRRAGRDAGTARQHKSGALVRAGARVRRNPGNDAHACRLHAPDGT